MNFCQKQQFSNMTFFLWLCSQKDLEAKDFVPWILNLNQNHCLPLKINAIFYIYGEIPFFLVSKDFSDNQNGKSEITGKQKIQHLVYDHF